MDNQTSMVIAEPDAPVEDAGSGCVTRADLTEAVRACALLADLTISVWSGERTDRGLSTKIKEDAGAVGNTGRYLKNLLAGCDTQLKELRAAYTAARALHYQLTLPWVSSLTADRQSGPRLLPNLLFERYLKEMSALRRIAHTQREAFVNAYPDLVVRAQANLAGLANASDYPAPEEVWKMFKLTFDFTPIPSAGGFVGLDDNMLEKLGKQLRTRQEIAVQASQGAMWERVRDTVGHLVERLSDPKAIFKAASVDSVRELVMLLPGFNCAGDPRVTTVVSDIERMLNGVSPEMLRKNATVRADVAQQAQAINSKLAQWGL